MVDLADARRLAHRERLRNEAAALIEAWEEEFSDRVRASFRAVFAPVLERFTADDVVTAASFASPDDLNSIMSSWAAEIDHTLLPMVAEMFDVGALSGLLSLPGAVERRSTDARLDLLDDVLNRNAFDHLQSSYNRLKGIGDTAWAAARDELLQGFTLGEPVPDLAARIQNALDVSEARAVTIARTEVISSSNAGSLAGVSALGEYGPERKQWLATVDNRTRDSHVEADGQTVGMDETFVVGGYDLEYPGDPAGPPEEVVNCRCTLIYVEAGSDPHDMDAPGRQEGGDDGDLSDAALADLVGIAASSSANPTQEQTMARAVRTRSGFTIPRPTFADPPIVEEVPVVEPVAEEPAPVVEEGPVLPATDEPGTTTLPVPAGFNVRPFEALMFVEGRWTGDERYLLPGAIRWDGILPISVDQNHDETVESTIGLIGEMFRVPNPANAEEYFVIGRGFFDLGTADRPHLAAQYVVDRIDSGVLRGASVSVDDITVGGVDPASLDPDDDPWWMMVTEDARVRALTVCPVGAFAECVITLDPEGIVLSTLELPPAPDGPVALPAAEAREAGDPTLAPLDDLEDDGILASGRRALVAAGSVGSLALVADVDLNAPPAAWFEDPGFDSPTPLTFTDDGRVFGHIATWGTCHTGFSGQCITPPHSASGYAAFRLGEVVTAEGARVATGKLTAGTGHASTQLSSGPAAAHYDETGHGVANVAAGEDDWGIWVAGAVAPEASPGQVATARSSPPSGDWRRIGTGMELIAALHVNVPGFPVPRARTASGVPQALVAAGTMHALGASRARKASDPVLESVAERIAASIGRDRGAVVASLVERVHGDVG